MLEIYIYLCSGLKYLIAQKLLFALKILMQIKFLSSKNTSIIDQKIWELYMMIVNVLFLWMVCHFMHWLKVWEWKDKIPWQFDSCCMWFLMAYSVWMKSFTCNTGLNRYLVDRLYLVNCFQISQAGLNLLIECLFGKQISASNG